MKQVLIRQGRIVVEEMPEPSCGDGEVLVRTAFSVISAGTEISGIRASSRDPALARGMRRVARIGEAARMVSRLGFNAGRAAVSARMEGASQPTGYSLSGIVLGVGREVSDLAPGQRVACAGAASAHHAERVSVPRNLVVPIPTDLPLEPAAFVTLGAIALHAVRQADLRLGESACVLGLGLVGQLVTALLRVSGCRVVGADPVPARVERARALGLEIGSDTTGELLEAAVENLTAGRGVDAVLITAASSSSEPVQRAVRLVRPRGRIVVVGDVGMELDRATFYMKEAELRISRAYGPGRYDPGYERHGRDYPFEYVRWTENRNMAEFLLLAAGGAVPVGKLVDRCFPVERAAEAYESLGNGAGGNRPLGVLLRYDLERVPPPVRSVAVVPRKRHSSATLGVAVVGLGTMARTVHLPNLMRLPSSVTLRMVVGRTAGSAREAARRFAAENAASDLDVALDDESVDVVLICTRHDLHVDQAIRALQAGKAVFLEKPAAIDLESLSRLQSALDEAARPFTVGFNRRFAPDVLEAQALLAGRRGPLVAHYRVNAGRLPPDHWARGPEGGGRLVGEACHMIDLLDHLVGRPRTSYSLDALVPADECGDLHRGDNFVLTSRYSDGSIMGLTYTSLGHRSMDKERLELHWDGRGLVLEDFRGLRQDGAQGREPDRGEPDKGHLTLLKRFLDHVAGEGPEPIPRNQILHVSRFVLELDRETREGLPREPDA
jgi:predicted dehydrogenase